MFVRIGAAAAVGALIAHRGLRKGSLNTSGAMAAFVVGAGTLAVNASFGLALLLFYFTGSAFTRHKEGVKRLYDLEVRGGGGQRGITQVLATAGGGLALALLYASLTDGQDEGLCVVAGESTSEHDRLRSLLVLAYLG
jgi:uncharacterized membrane protein